MIDESHSINIGMVIFSTKQILILNFQRLFFYNYKIIIIMIMIIVLVIIIIVIVL